MMRESTPSKWRVWFERLDWVLLGLIAALGGIGVLNLASVADATSGKAVHLTQAGWLLVGFVVMGIVSLVDYRVIERWAYLLYGVVVLLLVAVLAVGTELNGSQRWLNLGVILVQPSELLKLVVIVVTARYFNRRDLPRSYSLFELVRIGAVVGAAVCLVLIQPDLGTSLIILAIFFTMVLFEGVKPSSLICLVLAGLFALPLAWSFVLKEYQQDRVISYLNLDDDEQGQSWQVRQSMIAFGSGRMWGKGHVEGTQVQKGFVPEHENDFVSANWAEERGFVGMVFLLGLYSALLLWALHISRRARDRFGAHIGVGVAALIFWHVVVNLGMVTGVLPVVGLTLPLLSYGGSSLLTMMVALGLLLNVSMRRKPLAAAY
ncbi:MAG: rod shape-determining protein RodA [Persicimonas sp.]